MMAQDGVARLRSKELVALRNAHIARLSALFEGRVVDPVFVLCGCRGQAEVDPYSRPTEWVSAALRDLATRADALRDPTVFRPLVIQFGPYGVHFIDRILGAHVYELREPGNWQVACLDTPVGGLRPPDLGTDPTWALARELAEAFIAAKTPVPLFGMATLSSALNVLLNLYGQECLVAMLADPEATRHDLRVINDVIGTLHEWYRAHVPAAQLQPVVADCRTQPPGFGQICGCSTQLLSADLYREFIAPLDGEILSAYPGGGMIHLCGTHTQHIPIWREMGCVRALQLNDRAADDLPAYFAGLRDDQVLYVNAYPGMAVDRIMELTGGRRVVIVADHREPLRAHPSPPRAAG